MSYRRQAPREPIRLPLVHTPEVRSGRPLGDTETLFFAVFNVVTVTFLVLAFMITDACTSSPELPKSSPHSCYRGGSSFRSECAFP